MTDSIYEFSLLVFVWSGDYSFFRLCCNYADGYFSRVRNALCGIRQELVNGFLYHPYN
ncbi:MAG: hypothetical protein BWY71_02080 [Planctomycetes bacterium ADurb.Bin412]|nr:MAG: hypothetical protein BWY71_02080 [Planctomycetes bacterium ADurb.Bin412]